VPPSPPRGPALTVDAVVFTIRSGHLSVLLVRRGRAPFKGAFALPGGFVDANEPLEKATARELEEETGLTGVTFEQLGAFGDPGRDPRGHTVSVVSLAFLPVARPVVAGDDAAAAEWVPIGELPVEGRIAGKKSPRLAFDHARILEYALRRLRERLLEPFVRPKTAPRDAIDAALGEARASRLELVPARFTLSELQLVYQVVLGRELDKRNFRARLRKRGVVEPVGVARTGRHRPAELFRFVGTENTVPPDEPSRVARPRRGATKRR
jgi:8-oxo-dGTP diphosphatase